MLYRLCAKVLLKHSFRPDLLLPFQLGAGWKRGVEPVILAEEKALEGSLQNEHSHLVLLDFSNAFDCIDRRDLASALKELYSQLILGW